MELDDSIQFMGEEQDNASLALARCDILASYGAIHRELMPYYKEKAMCFSFPHTPDKFTSTEKMILEYMSSHRDEFLFMTIGQLSAALNISEATVSRFARHAGCEDFKHLKQVVMEQTVQKGPAQKLSNTLRSGNGELLRHCIDQQQYNLQKTLELLDQKEFDHAVRAMLAAARCWRV